MKALLLILTLCAMLPATAQVNPSDNSKVKIPENFTAAQSTLLIQQDADMDSSFVSLSTDMRIRTDVFVSGHIRKKAMAEYADKNLSLKHEYVSQSAIYDSSGQYADKNQYRFALVIELIKQAQHIRTGTMMESTYYQPIFRFRLYDRLTGKTYAELGNGSSMFMSAFKSAIKKISKPISAGISDR